MGECSSRPNYVDIANHIAYRNTVNDAYFNEVKLMPGDKREGLLAALKKGEKSAAKTATDYLESLRGQSARAEGRLQKLSEKTQTKIVMEIRKGVDLYPLGFPKVKGLLVEVNVSAIDKVIRTRIGDPYIPKWYHLAYIAYNEASQCPEKAELSILSVDAAGEEEKKIAGCEIDLRESIDTTLVRWHLLKWEYPFEVPNVMPQIEIRYWNLRSLEAFWTNIKALADNEVEMILLAAERGGLAVK